MEVKSISYEQCKQWFLKKHYAKRMPSVSYSFGMVIDGKIEGVVSFGMPPTPFLSKIFNKGEYLELNRLVINSNMPKNYASMFISKSFNLLKQYGNFVIVSYADPNQGHTGFIYQATNWIYTGMGRVNQKDKRGVNKFFFNDKEYHERHIPETMYRLSFIIDSNATKNENWVNNGGIILPQKRKHRYFYIIGDKRFKKYGNRKIIEKFNICEYPKEESKRYDCIDIIQTQITLF